MSDTRRNLARAAAAVVLIVTLGFALNVPQVSPSIRRVELQRHDLGAPGREVIQVRVEFRSGASLGEHSHPGEEIVYVLEGALEYRVQGKQPTTIKSGGVLFIPAGIVHSAKNVGRGSAAELATYLVEKGKPLVVMAE